MSRLPGLAWRRGAVAAIALLRSLREEAMTDKQGLYNRRQETCRRRRVLFIRPFRDDAIYGARTLVPEVEQLPWLAL